MGRILQVFYTVFSAILLSLAIPNELFLLGSPLFGFLSLIPFYLALSRSKSFAEAGLLTAVQFMCVNLMSSFWLIFFKDFAVFTLGGTTLWYGLTGLAAGCFLYIPFYRGHAERSLTVRSSFPLRMFLFAALWTLWEWIKSIGFLAYPWGTVIMSVYRFPLFTQFADITGTWGFSFFIALSGAFGAETIAAGAAARWNPKRIPSIHGGLYAKAAVCYVSLFILILGYGAVQYGRTRTPEKNMEAVLVQQNTDSWNPGADIRALEISESLTAQAAASAGRKPDLVVWSESVLRYSYPHALNYYSLVPEKEPLIPFIQKLDTPFLIGNPALIDAERGYFMNSAGLIVPSGIPAGIYGKMQLVPFAERIPFSEYEWMRSLMDRLVGFSQGWTPGTELHIFEIPLKQGGTVKFSTPICFEDAFPGVCRALFNAGSEVFVNITNDSWSLTRSAEYQHFVISVFRAIEMRTTLVRATNSGYTVIADPAGKVLDSLPLFEEAALYANVPVYERTVTPYALLGDWFPVLMLVLLTAYVIYGKSRDRKTS